MCPRTFFWPYFDRSLAHLLLIGLATNLLVGYSFTSASLTVTSCVAECNARGFRYAGAEYGSECYCGNSFEGGDTGGGTIASSECTMNCPGDATQICGAGFRLSSYEKRSNTTVAPVLPSGWSYTGCVKEPTNGRALTSYSFTDPGMTIDKCVATCNTKGFLIAGAEYANECYCGDAFQNTASGGGASAPNDCTMACAGSESTQKCGSGGRLSIYSAPQTTPPPPPPPNNVILPAGWAYVACTKEPASGRLLAGYTFTSSSLTVESCVATCKSRGFVYAGTEYGNECYCGNGFTSTTVAASESDCSMPCAGKSSQMCGAGYRLSLYSSEPSPGSQGLVLPALYTKTAPTGSALPAGWSASMCAVDNAARVLTGYKGTDSALTPASCIAKCASLRFTLSGVENGNECYCGNILTNNPVGARDVQCGLPCAGDPSQNCGGGFRIMIYQKASFSSSRALDLANCVLTSESRPSLRLNGVDSFFWGY
ncbi:WSC domain-containing protein [Mycena belliarum]|uniref:WSC domain-containing protein n=1 Tax=Mycena belliarum TaxID=1033014 RepID=A0AAD6UD09_9AGAR|nr:WSC domain-containing protein [Mycena belliae]